MIYVDGAAFPTHRGTGSEDYFGYAFAHIYLFQDPWASQIAVAPQDSPQPNPPVFNYDGTTVLNRNRLLDVIPFNDHFRYDFEIHNNNDANSDVEVDHTTFFYALPRSVVLISDGPVSGKTFTIESKINGWNLTATPSGVTTNLKTNDGSQQFLATSVGTNVFTLENTYYNLYLGASSNGSGTALNLSAYNSSDCEQKWTIVDVYDTGTATTNPLGNGFNGYQSMINACNLSADVVDAGTAAGTKVQQYTVSGADSQYWRFNQWTGDAQLIADGVYNINNVATSLFVDVPNGSKSISQALQVYSRDTQASQQPAQQWTINYLGNGTYSILNVNSNLALDNSGTGSGTTLDQYTWTTGSNMIWHIVPAGPGQFNIQNVDNELYLSVGGNQTAGSPLLQQPLGSGTDQVWSFLFVPGT